MTIDELNLLFEKEKADMALSAPKGGEESYRMSPVQKALEHEYPLAKECFSSCSLEFFLFYNERIPGLFDYILWGYGKKELLNALDKHIASFHDQNANAYLAKIDTDYARAFDHKGGLYQTPIHKANRKMTIDDVYGLYEEEKKELSLPISYEGETHGNSDEIAKALKSNSTLAKKCFSTCPLDFFLWFNGNEAYDETLFFDVLRKHKDPELFKVLAAHVSSFHDSKADNLLEKLSRFVKNEYK
jgi:hypothetical protein